MTEIRIILVLIFIFFIFLSGCSTRSIPENVSVSMISQDNRVDSEPGKISAAGAVPTASVQDSGSFIRETFPDLTFKYSAIRTAIHDLNWNEAQNKSLNLEDRIREIKNSYPVNAPDSEKSIYIGLDNKQRIVLDKYLGYINNLEQYAINQKNAIYYRTQSADLSAKGTAKRYQDLADEFEKKVVTDVRTLDEYCKEFKYDYLDSRSVDKYSFIR